MEQSALSNQVLFALRTYKDIFWPKFLEHDGCVLACDMDQETIKIYRDWMTTLKGDKSATERVMNHRHIGDFIRDAAFNHLNEPQEDLILECGNLLKDMWQTKLRVDFPNKKFQVKFYDEPNDDLDDYQITFETIR